MVRPKDGIMNNNILNIIFEYIFYNKVVNAPSCIVLTCIKTVTPPCISTSFIRILVSEGIRKTEIKQFTELLPFLSRITRMTLVSSWILQVNFRRCNV